MSLREESPMAIMPPDKPKAEPSGAETIEELFAALESPLLSYALRLVGERTLAEDIVQEAFMRLHAQFEQVREPRRWLYRTAHNLALNQRRRESKIIPLVEFSEEASVTSPELHDPQPLPDEQIARLEGIGQVRLSLDTLDQRARELIRLKFHEGLSYKEISARTGLTPGHVGYLLHHAIKAVADELTKAGIAP